MGKQVIILEKASESPRYTVAYWLTVPAGREALYARPGAVSAWKDALPADNTAIAGGYIVEKVMDVNVLPGMNMAEIQTYLQTAWTKFQGELTNDPSWVRYGTTWDGTSWTLASK